MRPRLPPLHTLPTFEAAAKRLNFTLAAEDLHLTQSAVSQQIRQLEAHLGVQLFRRLTRQLVLTEQGEILYAATKTILGELHTTMERLKETESTVRLIVSVLPSFGSKWLVPRLHQFLNLYPGVRVTVLPSVGLVDFAKDDVDVALRWGKGTWSGVQARCLIGDIVFPVCSPKLLEQGSKIRAPNDLESHILLHDHTHDMWEEWFHAAGFARPLGRSGPVYDDASNLVQAAIDGQGIALARGPLVIDDLSAGRLIRILDIEFESDLGYYFVCPNAPARQKVIEDFYTWAKFEAEKTADALQRFRVALSG